MRSIQNTWAEVLVVPLSGCAAGGECDKKQVPLRQGYKLRPPAPTPSWVLLSPWYHIHGFFSLATLDREALAYVLRPLTNR